MELNNGYDRPNIGEGAENVPIGFGLSLAMNEQAMNRYSAMGEQERNGWLLRAGQVSSKAEMEELVRRMSEGQK